MKIFKTRINDGVEFKVNLAGPYTLHLLTYFIHNGVKKIMKSNDFFMQLFWQFFDQFFKAVIIQWAFESKYSFNLVSHEHYFFYIKI